MKSAFLPSKGLLRLYDKQNKTWLLVNMEFLFNSKRNSISTRAHVLFSIYRAPNPPPHVLFSIYHAPLPTPL